MEQTPLKKEARAARRCGESDYDRASVSPKGSRSESWRGERDQQRASMHGLVAHVMTAQSRGSTSA
eukprot:6018603-Pleurochrysis_carterae.AAC.1